MKEHPSDERGHVLFRSIIYFGFFLLLFQLMMSGTIRYYIAPKMMPFMYFLLAALLILGIVQLVRSTSDKEEDLYCDCGFIHQQSKSIVQTIIVYALFVIPILTGLWFPTVVLDSSIVAKRGVNYGASPPITTDVVGTDVGEDESSVEEDDLLVQDRQALLADEMDNKRLGTLKQELLDSDKIVIDDERYNDIMLIIHEDLEPFIGKEIELVGFVYKDDQTAENEFLIARFGITCCVADAFVYGIRSSSDAVAKLNEDDWVRATGTLSTYQLDDWTLPFIQITQLEQIDQPANPYIYNE